MCLLSLAGACAGRVEQQVLRGYFDTCAAADDVALSNAALVAMDPSRDGTVGRFRIVSVGPEVQQPASDLPRAAQLSLFDPHAPAGTFEPSGAVLLTETVLVSAEVHRGGVVRELPIEVTLARARTRETIGRWIVVRLVLGGRTLPEVSSGRRSQTAP